MKHELLGVRWKHALEVMVTRKRVRALTTDLHPELDRVTCDSAFIWLRFRPIGYAIAEWDCALAVTISINNIIKHMLIWESRAQLGYS
jgi:hypothetical protein